MTTTSQIRDPIHGVIYLNSQERAVIESHAFQRLRGIKQLGFADFAFPGATHTRFAHSLGAMNFAGKMFDRIMAKSTINQTSLSLFRQVVRLAALLHDVGHPPLSHTTEMLMPLKTPSQTSKKNERVKHEDYSLSIILNSSLTECIKKNFGSDMAIMVAALLAKDSQNNFFAVANIDYSPLLRQIISSEIDCDRMDYLLRDSFYCGVNYGKFDSDWLVENLLYIIDHKKAYLAIKARALFAFEDFLLSRYHMFLSVYLHHTPVIMEKMLAHFFSECPKEFILPSDIENYLAIDDVDLWWALRHSKNSWAQRIVQKKPYVLLIEQVLSSSKIPPPNQPQIIEQALTKAGIEVISTHSKSSISHYFNTSKSMLFVQEPRKDPIKLEKFSSLFIRYQVPTQIDRIFVDPHYVLEAQQIVDKLQRA
ncbi:MAG: HD domain-containing protein [Myxococcales bacterium]|nr:HD domain-containing protein [Myxococcales bacterium]USN50598.1 MAG: HD domain-containing protein [Myxococcales bacterium]